MATITKEGSLSGYVDVAYPEGAENATTYESGYESIQRIVSLEEAGFDLG